MGYPVVPMTGICQGLIRYARTFLLFPAFFLLFSYNLLFYLDSFLGSFLSLPIQGSCRVLLTSIYLLYYYLLYS